MIGPAPQVRGSNWQLAALLGGIVLGNVDIAIVSIAAPSIRDDLSASGLQQGRGEAAPARHRIRRDWRLPVVACHVQRGPAEALLGLGGLGYGAAFSATLDHVTSIGETRHATDVSGLFNTILQIGGVVGVAVFGTVYLDLAPTSGAAAVSAFSTVTFALAALALAAAASANKRSAAPEQIGRAHV